MDLAKKLQLPPGQRIRILNAPPGLALGLPSGEGPGVEAVLVFVQDSEALRAKGRPALEAARRDHLAWIAYPKAGQMGTDLSRDALWKLAEPEGVQAVRQVSIDGVWSALRFRPATARVRGRSPG